MTRDDVAAVLIDELDIDSMDFLNLVTALSERLKIDIPETDYPKLATFGHAVDYLVQRLGVAARPVTSSQQPEPNHRGLPSLGRKSS